MPALVSDALFVPFVIEPSADHVLVTVDSRAGEHPVLRTAAATLWITEHPDQLIVVDLGQIALLDSALVAWLITLARTAIRSRILVQGAGARAEGQLRHLRLDRLLTIG